MPVMEVGKVRMRMGHRLVAVGMAMRLARRFLSRVRVPVVFVVRVQMVMLHRFVAVGVFVLLGEMEPDTPSHQDGSRDQARVERFTEQGDGDQRADEGREREVGPGPRRAEMA